MPARARRGGIPRSVWALGLGSLLMDTSSELIHSVLPLFMVVSLGASAAAVGVVEGIAEAASAFSKLASGALSDRWRRRKPLVLLGYGLSTVTKPLFPLADSVATVLAARFADRLGKGIRGAPRDALIADITPAGARGAAYGLRQALDSVGAFLGPLLAVLLLSVAGDDLRPVLWVAVIPAAACVLTLAVGVEEPPRHAGVVGSHDTGGLLPEVGPARARTRLPVAFWAVAVLGAAFTMARFSEAFLVLRAHDAGLALGLVPLVMVVMNVVYAASAYPGGAVADRRGSRRPLVAGIAVLVLADLILASSFGPAGALAGAALWGLHLGLTQGQLAKLVADSAPAELHGSAFGVFNGLTGLALLAASALAGALWTAVGPEATFGAGAAFAAGSLVLVPLATRPAT